MTNNEEILVKNGRYKLVSDDANNILYNNIHDKNVNEEYAIKESKGYNLQICPVKFSDSGWYNSRLFFKMDWFIKFVKMSTFDKGIRVMWSNGHGTTRMSSITRTLMS